MLQRRPARHICALGRRLTPQHMRTYHRQMLDRLAIGIANEDTLGHASGVLAIDFLQQFRHRRQRRLQGNMPPAVPRLRDAGVFQNVKAIDEERPELGIAGKAGECNSTVAVRNLQRDIMAGPIDRGIKKKTCVVEHVVPVGATMR